MGRHGKEFIYHKIGSSFEFLFIFHRFVIYANYDLQVCISILCIIFTYINIYVYMVIS